MNDLLKNKKLVIGIAIVVILVIFLTFYILFNKSSTSKNGALNVTPTEEIVPTIAAAEIGFTLTAGADGKRVVLGVANTQDITSLDYELSYTSKDDIPRGAIGHIDVKTKGQVVKQEIVLGTCSDVCHYDQDVSNIKLILKITKTDGKVFQAEQTLEL